MQQHLLDDPSLRVQNQLIRKQELSLATLGRLVARSEDDALQVASRPELPPTLARQLVGHPSTRVRVALAQASESVELDLALCSDPCADVRLALVSQPAMAWEVQARLVDDPEPRVRLALALLGPRLPGELLEHLATEDASRRVRRAARRRLGWPPPPTGASE